MTLNEGQRVTGAPCGGCTLVVLYVEKGIYSLEKHKLLHPPNPKVGCLHMKIIHIDGHASCLNPRISELERTI